MESLVTDYYLLETDGQSQFQTDGCSFGLVEGRFSRVESVACGDKYERACLLDYEQRVARVKGATCRGAAE